MITIEELRRALVSQFPQSANMSDDELIQFALLIAARVTISPREAMQINEEYAFCS